MFDLRQEIAIQLLPSCREQVFQNNKAMHQLRVETEDLEQQAADLAVKQADALIKALSKGAK